MDFPECSDDELVVLNNFGQPVCHCASDTHPLEDPFSVQDITDQKKCYHISEQGPCLTDEVLVLPDDDNSPQLLTCVFNFAAFSAISDSMQPNNCPSGEIKAFGFCRPSTKF